MPVTITQLRSGVQANLEAVVSNGTPLQVHRTWPGMVVPPAAIVDWKKWRVETVDGSLKSYDFEAIVVCQFGELETAQDELDAMASEDGVASVIDALYADQTLGGVARSIRNIECDKSGGTIRYPDSEGGIEYAGFVLSWQVLA